jgi:replication fork protection complex subunit Tof1/Swi1
MCTGKSDEDSEIGNNILLNLFYDENNLDMIASIVRQYKRQSFGFVVSLSYSNDRYLDACTSLTHTILKVLEAFSEDRRLYIKSKRQRKVKKNANEGESESDDDRPSNRTVAEKAFQFQSFETVSLPLSLANSRNL